MSLQPTNYLRGAFVWREDWIEDVLDSPEPDDKGQAFQEAHALYFEGRQVERVAQFEFSVAQDFEGKMQPVGHFLLILGGLGAEAKDFGSSVPLVLHDDPGSCKFVECSHAHLGSGPIPQGVVFPALQSWDSNK